MSDSPERQEHSAESKPQGAAGMLDAVLKLPNDSPKKMLIVAVALCLECSVVVSSAAVLLRPLQLENAALDRKRNIVEVAGLLGELREAGMTSEDLRHERAPRIVELAALRSCY